MVLFPRLPTHSPMRTPTSATMALVLPPIPTATADSVLAVAGISGGIAVALQLGLVALLKQAKGKPWLSDAPGYVAHQLIALVFMLIATVVGTWAWLSPAAWAGSSASRFLVDNGTTRFLAAMLFGELILWDLPCAIWIKQLRRPDSVIHHVAMAAVAFNAAWLAPIFYGAFYLGLVEMSTLPLNIHEYYAHAAKVADQASSGSSSALVQRFKALRDVFQAASAAGFVMVRGVLFTAVSLRRFFPEVSPLLFSEVAGQGLRWPLLGHAVGVGTFNVLQLYWLGLLIQYTLANGMGGERPD